MANVDYLQELKNHRDILVKELNNHDEDEKFYHKLQEDIWNINDEICILENEIDD